MAFNIVIVDHGTGNTSSVRRSMARIGVDCRVSSDAAEIGLADKLILAGVGHFGSAMAGLERLGFVDALDKAVLVDKKPVLGICLGMELMANESEEGGAKGLGWIDARVVRFVISDKLHYKVPHLGWNAVVTKKKDSPLMRNIAETDEFYFLHSYYLELADESDLLNETQYETAFPSAIEKGNIFGVQFHPEKSHDAGLQLLKNFAEL